ncbi:MAG: FKBP-type peptidyl-prolyl cis-trans isomerase [Bacteroidia bacterium]|jgi:FKBP-type peptidyl-prolyl cis-trans isomerase|nr:FKBP-type peptidyl-prolyl cis-trans isomerase [Bacteroidia bacterium]
MNKLEISLLIMFTLIATGCETNKWQEHENRLINNYLISLEDTVYVHYSSGLYYIELIPGTGRSPVDLDTVYFKYKAAFTDYVQFDKNIPYSTPYKHVMGTFEDVQIGVDEGLRYMKEGGTSRLLTPSSLAFGFEGIHGIVAGYTPILWTIKLDSIKRGTGR